MENRQLRDVFETIRKEVTGGCSKFRSEDLRGFYFSPHIIRAIWAGLAEYITEMINVYSADKSVRTQPF
jgi:hypothetical protein